MSDNARSNAATKLFDPDSSPTFFGQYRILGTIGHGGMGTVFKAHHIHLKKDVAIKTLRVDKITTPDLVERFRREMELVGQMDHPNVVRATDAGERNGVFYLVMEFLPGADLSTLTTSKGRLDLCDACELIRQAAVGLDYVHHTLVHRDVKPSNLMLTTAGVVKVLDLGLACGELGGAADGERTPDGIAVGTFQYMAPEQARGGRHIDGRADLYSLGCSLFKLVTGKAPYGPPEFDTAAKQIFAHANVPLSALEGFVHVPEQLRSVLLRLTAKDPEERYRSGREVAQALTPFAVGSRPAQLLGGKSGAEESVVHPLGHPLPEELSRLTASLGETPSDTITKPTIDAPPPPGPARPYRKWARWALFALIPVALTIVAAPFVWRREAAPVQKTASERNLDILPRDKRIRLLDCKPVPIGWELDNTRTHQWNENDEFLNVTGERNMLFLLGSTKLASFEFEVRIKQAEWTGEVGVFWGYHEDAARKEAMVPRQDFAWFQFLRIEHRIGQKGETVRFVHRGIGTLAHGPQGDVALRLPGLHPAEIQRLIGQIQMKAEIFGNRLAKVDVGANALSQALCGGNINEEYKDSTCAGGFGVFSRSHAATFSDAYFVPRSKN